MWFKRKKKSDQDSALNESLRSLQGMLEERQEPSLGQTPAEEAAEKQDDEGADRIAPSQRRAPFRGPDPDNWRGLSLNFDAEPTGTDERRARLEESAKDAAGNHIMEPADVGNFGDSEAEPESQETNGAAHQRASDETEVTIADTVGSLFADGDGTASLGLSRTEYYTAGLASGFEDTVEIVLDDIDSGDSKTIADIEFSGPSLDAQIRELAPHSADADAEASASDAVETLGLDEHAEESDAPDIVKALDLGDKGEEAALADEAEILDLGDETEQYGADDAGQYPGMDHYGPEPEAATTVDASPAPIPLEAPDGVEAPEPPSHGDDPELSEAGEAPILGQHTPAGAETKDAAKVGDGEADPDSSDAISDDFDADQDPPILVAGNSIPTSVQSMEPAASDLAPDDDIDPEPSKSKDTVDSDRPAERPQEDQLHLGLDAMPANDNIPTLTDAVFVPGSPSDPDPAERWEEDVETLVRSLKIRFELGGIDRLTDVQEAELREALTEYLREHR